ncbi:hypothetical protein ACH5RR_030047 [Cinchona calisaya]|uniref:Repressor of RNA polymerase III transcription n=1 Tax=Cinchona calisaya TaxID=153742 RepID=A0ABD2YUW3_9GENT
MALPLLNVMKGEPLVTKLAVLSKYAVLPCAMIAALIYSPPDYALSKKPQSFSASKIVAGTDTVGLCLLCNLKDSLQPYRLILKAFPFSDSLSSWFLILGNPIAAVGARFPSTEFAHHLLPHVDMMTYDPYYRGRQLVFMIKDLFSGIWKPCLSLVNLGERTISGCFEAYSCKHTRADKKLSLSLENEIVDYFGKSSAIESSSPVECLYTSSRKTLIYLLLTLYHMYPDYDFSAVQAHQFFTEESWDCFKQIFDTYMFEASKEWLEANECPLLDTLYKCLDEVVKLAECKVYGYNAEADADPFLDRGAIWSFHFFFYNRKLKRVVSFRFSCLSNLAGDGFLVDELSFEEDGEIFDGMDI